MANESIGLTNLQQELLRLYANQVSDQTLLEIKSVLARYFAEKASVAMDESLQKQHLTPEDMNGWANGHNRSQDRP